MSQCPLTGGVPLLEVTNVVFVCGQYHAPVPPLGIGSCRWWLQL